MDVANTLWRKNSGRLSNLLKATRKISNKIEIQVQNYISYIFSISVRKLHLRVNYYFVYRRALLTGNWEWTGRNPLQHRLNEVTVPTMWDVPCFLLRYRSSHFYLKTLRGRTGDLKITYIFILEFHLGGVLQSLHLWLQTPLLLVWISFSIILPHYFMQHRSIYSDLN